VTHVLLSVKNQVAKKQEEASSSANVNRLLVHGSFSIFLKIFKLSKTINNKTIWKIILPYNSNFLKQAFTLVTLKKKWNPKMLPYIFAEKKGIHIIDLNKTVEGLQEAAAALKAIARSGKKIMFVATKKQAKEIVSECAKK
jgi:hypothetical protein